jgi:hypothetical protein
VKADDDNLYDEKHKKYRGHLRDIAYSCAWFRPKNKTFDHLKDRPFFILYKTHMYRIKYATYHLIVNDKKEWMFPKLQNVPPDLQKLLSCLIE